MQFDISPKCIHFVQSKWPMMFIRFTLGPPMDDAPTQTFMPLKLLEIIKAKDSYTRSSPLEYVMEVGNFIAMFYQ